MRPGEGDMGALMVRAQAGDRASYRLLLEAARDWLTRYYRVRLPPAMVEDAVQDALIAIHNKRGTFDGARPFEPWMGAIARFLWIDRLRRMRRQAEGAAPRGEEVEGARPAIGHATDLARLMAELKPAQADAIRLVKLQGYSVEEASQLTGQSPSLIKVNVHRGLARLTRLVRAWA